MKNNFFHLMPYRYLPDDVDWKTRGVWVDVPSSVYDPQKGHGLYNEYLDELEWADKCGFDGICVNEHHQNAYGTMPSPNIMLASLIRRTQRANLIVLGNSIALYNPPIRVAEEIAMMDVISGGRIVAGFPVGTSRDDNFNYGLPGAILRDKYHEAADLIVQAWTRPEMFAFHGKYNQLRYVNIWPRPLQKPHPPIWVPGGGSVETWEWTTEKDYVYAALSFGGFKRAKKTLDGFWNTVRAMKADENPYRAGYLQLVLVSESAEQAKKDYREGVEYFFQKLVGTGSATFGEAPGYRTERTIRAGFQRSGAAVERGNIAKQGLTWDELIDEGNIIAGSPDQVAEALVPVIKDLRFGQMMALLQIGSMNREQTMKNVEMYGRYVIPLIKDVWRTDWEDRWSPKPIAERVLPSPDRGQTVGVVGR
jgi:alkanesulfonate monooxygenase SsuD/methylene tetrahydromethanopterin reductase-like flavin-dependent oxidoreductase (luciferase family)